MEAKTSVRDAGASGPAGIATALGMGLAAALVACAPKTDPAFLGSSILEAQTFQVAATVQGRLSGVYAREGSQVAEGDLLAVVDTVPLGLQLKEAEAGLLELAAGLRAREHEIKAAQAEVRSLENDYSRIAPLVKEGALPLQQGDRLAASLDAARLKLAAARDMLASLRAKRDGLSARVEWIQEQIRRCYLRSPARGLVLTRYRNAEEVVGAGQPVFEIGRDDTLHADFFVPQVDLAGIRHGQTVRLRLDGPGDPGFLPATVTWIGQEAEFSPRNIQTRESRNELFFRVRAQAANRDGLLKRGLPVEVWKAE
jgi:HlyD family secretion protein